MGGPAIPGFADRVIAAIAGRQFGVVARWQLLAVGVTRRQMDVRLRTGRLHALHPGVYLVGHEAAQPYAREKAALLALGQGVTYTHHGELLIATRSAQSVVLSHRTAAALWELSPYPAPGAVCITVPPRMNNVRSGIEVHRAVLDPRDIRERHAMPLTSPSRTILDLAAHVGRRAAVPSADPLAPNRLDELERLVAEAQYRRLASEAELRTQIERNPRKHGVPALGAVLDLPGGPRRTRSGGERALLRLLRAHGIRGFETNATVAGHEVDFLWRDQALAVEVDGYDAHSGRVAFERDRLKVATLEATGLTVMPVTGRQVRRDPDGVVTRIVAALRARS